MRSILIWIVLCVINLPGLASASTSTDAQPSSADAYAVEAMKHLRAGKKLKAIASLRQAYGITPRVGYLETIAMLYGEIGDQCTEEVPAWEQFVAACQAVNCPELDRTKKARNEMKSRCGTSDEASLDTTADNLSERLREAGELESNAPTTGSRSFAEVWLSAGMSGCMSDGNSKCDSGDPTYSSGWGVQATAGYRFHQYVGVYIDVRLSTLTPESEIIESTSITTIMPTLRGFYAIDRLEFWLGVGMGYQNFVSKGTATVESGIGDIDVVTRIPVSQERTHSMDPKVELGAAYELTKDLSLGLTTGMIFQTNEAGELCYEGPGNNRCLSDPNGAIFKDLMHLDLVARYRF